ncbi:MAG: hypothetical protein AAFZ15_33870 [Bacteroidota bacterium]
MKPNLWTLLFVVALGAFLMEKFNAPETGGPVPDTSDPCVPPPSNPDQIDADKAESRIIAYADYIAALAADPALDDLNLVFPYVELFAIPKADLLSAYCAFNNETVYAVMAINPGTDGAKDTLDLIFTDIDQSARNGTGSYFDFSTPCPPLGNCGSSTD